MAASSPNTMDLDADYVVYGAGAMGMAFVDALLKEKQVSVIMVDRHSQPGGHWNDAYPFVRLHQPSKFYGVNSRILERSKDELELAPRSEILAYYEAVMDGFLSSGHVSFFPMCSMVDDVNGRTFRSLVEPGKTYQISARAKIVNATYMNVEVPSISTPQAAGRFQVDSDVELVPLNDLVKCASARDNYVVIGAGKTGMDAVLWLLRNSVHPDRIHWIMPRDSWILRREMFQANELIYNLDIPRFMEAAIKATTADEYLLGVEAERFITRIDKSVKPLQYKCATASESELEQLRRVSNVVRMGRVTHITKDGLTLEKGKMSMSSKGTLYVDCSTDGLATRPAIPVFQGNIITLQAVMMCQQVFSAALLGYVESFDAGDEEKNSLSTPVPHPDVHTDVIRCELQNAINLKAWGNHPKISKWLKRSRLFGMAKPETFLNWRQLMVFAARNVHRLPFLLRAENEKVRNLHRLSKL